MAITSSSIVATPSKDSWSQAVSFLPFFVVISLKKTVFEEKEPEIPNEEAKEQTLEEVIEEEGSTPEESVVKDEQTPKTENELATIGKQVLQKLSEDLLNLETVAHSHLKETIEKIRVEENEGMELSLVVAAVDEKALYTFCEGEVRVLLKRKGKFGVLVETKKGEKTSLSGYLENGDTVVIETKAFSEIVPDSELSETVDSSPSEISEVLSPQIHKSENALASSLFFTFEEEEAPQIAIEPDTLQEGVAKEDSKKKRLSFSVFDVPISSHLNSLRERLGGKRMFLGMTAILLVLFLGGVYFSLNTRSNAQQKALFDRVYKEAEGNYEEGQSLISLNKDLAREDFLAAKKTLEEIKNEFDEDSEERKKIDELLERIENALSGATSAVVVEPKVVSENESDLIKVALSGEGSYFAQNSDSIFSLDENTIYSTPRGEDEQGTFLENDDLWETAGALGVYNTNLYVLDKSTGEIYKFIGDDGSSRSEYLNDGSYNFRDATSMTIDGSIYVLLKSGKVFKFLRGAEETFEITNLETPISNATRIFTDEDTDNLYILDNGNSRIVVIDKNGIYKSEYRSPAFSKAREIDVKESEGKLYFLVEDKVFGIDLN